MYGLGMILEIHEPDGIETKPGFRLPLRTDRIFDRTEKSKQDG